MIDVIDVLQHRKRGHLGGGSCEQSERLLGVVAYHHELVVELGEERFNALAEPLVSPCRRSPVLLVEPVGNLEGNAGCLHNLGCARHSPQASLGLCSHWHEISEFVNTIPGEFLVDVEYFYEVCDEVVHERGYSS